MIYATLVAIVSVISVFLIIFLIQLALHLFDKNGYPKYGGIYSVEGPYFRIKYWIILLLLKIRKYKENAKNKKIFDPEYKHYAKSIEKPQPLTLEDGIDSVYFFCTGTLRKKETNCKSNVDIVIRIARRKNRICEFWMIIKEDNGFFLVQPNYPETSIYNCSPSEWKSLTGLSIYCDRPNEKWTIKYHGWLKENTEEGKPIHVNLKLCFRSFTHIVDSHKDTSDELSADSVARERWSKKYFQDLRRFGEKNQTHYEQFGTYVGTLSINRHEEYYMDSGKGYRDHSFGIRSWNQYQRYGSIFGYLENGSCISLGSVCCRKTLSHIRYGYYITPYGETVPITYHNFNLWEVFLSSPPRSKLIIEFYAKGRYELKLEEFSEVRFNLNKGKNLIFERFIKFELNGIHGKGINEFCASDAVPRIKYQDVSSISILNESSISINHDFCLSLESDESRNRNISGGKGCQLADLKRLNKHFKEINVPRGFIITIEAYNAFIEANKEIQTFIESLTNGNTKTKNNENMELLCANILSEFTYSKLPQQIQDAIVNQLKQEFGEEWSSISFAIRSSSSDEDSSVSSSAGQMSTYLGVKGLDNIIEMIKKCWASQYSFIAVSYRRRNGLSLKSVMGVVIMEMVPSNTSGVIFTVNPLNGDATRMILNATYGLGEPLVSGKCDSDQIEIEKFMDGSVKIVSKIIGKKEIREDLSMEGIIETTENSHDELCLSDDVILKLSEIAILIEKCYGEPCDLEWAEVNGEVIILQTRSITNINNESSEELIKEFDSAVSFEGECLTTANIGEMMPMATTPLTLSLFGSAVNRALQFGTYDSGLLSSFMDSRRYIPSFSNHLFLNIHCLSVLSEKSNLEMLFVSILGRVLEKPHEIDISNFIGSRSRFQTINLLLRKIMAMRSGYLNTKEWETKFKCGYKIQLKKTASQQMKVILDQTKDYYTCWFDTIQNTSISAFWNMILFKMLKNKEGWNNTLYSNVATLLSSCSDVISADVPNALKDISIIIGRDENFKKIFLNENDEFCLNWLKSDKSKEAGEKFKEFLRRHGHRCIREAEFIERSWRDCPEKVITAIRTMVKHLKEEDYVNKTEMTIEMALDKLHLNVNFLKRKIIQWILVKARNGVSLREWGKSISIEMCDAFKQAFFRLGELMVNENLIPARDLIYFFTFDELVSILVYKEEQISNILNKIQKRKQNFQEQMKTNMPEICFGNPYNMEETLPTDNNNLENQIKLSGFTVGIGRISGYCRVISTIEEAAEINPGEILVVPYTDVGWTPYFPLLGGLITEKGGVLSHGAVVAREYGLPCLVGCSGATKILRTGNHILLNATEGTVEICGECISSEHNANLLRNEYLSRTTSLENKLDKQPRRTQERKRTRRNQPALIIRNLTSHDCLNLL